MQSAGGDKISLIDIVGDQIGESTYAGWSMVGAENYNSKNQVIFKWLSEK